MSNDYENKSDFISDNDDSIAEPEEENVTEQDLSSVDENAPSPEPETDDELTADDTAEEEESPRLWSEPEYEAAAVTPEDVYSPNHSVYTQPVTAAEPEKKKKKKKNHGFLKAVCIILVAVLLSSCISYGITDQMLKKYSAENTRRQVVIGSNTSDIVKDSGTTSAVYTGNVMSAESIYSMACEQVVGVNTSINTVNFFGQTSTSAVSGSGFIISEDGYIMTNYHVISYAVKYGGTLTVLLHNGESYDASIIGYVEENDVAIIKIDASGLNAVTLGDSENMIVGETVYAIGNPLGELSYTMTSGIVSALDRVISTSDSTTGSVTSINMFQIDAAVNAGNSGGPVYNAYGEVLGIVTAKYSDEGVEGLGFAIPINDALSLATQLIEKGHVTGAALGVNVANVENVFSSFTIEYYSFPYGAYVMTVNEGSCAANGGIRTGDIITAIDGTSVSSTDELKMMLRKYNPGDPATITVYRSGGTLGEGEYYDLDVVLDESTASTTVPSTSTTLPETGTNGTDGSEGTNGNNGNGGSGSYFPFPWGGWYYGGSGNGSNGYGYGN